MKRYIKNKTFYDNISDGFRYSEDRVTRKIKVDFIVSLPSNLFLESINSATYKGLYVPEGDLPPAAKDAIFSSQALQDYYDFVESVEDLLTDRYGLKVYYKNISPDHSFYYGLLAENDDRTLLLDFDITLRIATHPAHRIPESQKHKKEQKEELLKVTDGKETWQSLRYSIIVNDKTQKSYEDAFFKVDDLIEMAVKKIGKRAKIKKKRKN